MTLKVEDLKAGDVVRIDMRVELPMDHDGEVQVNVGKWNAWLSNDLLAACNAEKVVRARPVRKGDEIRYGSMEPGRYLGELDDKRYALYPISGSPFTIRDLAAWTHADGSPISWEDSE